MPRAFERHSLRADAAGARSTRQRKIGRGLEKQSRLSILDAVRKKLPGTLPRRYSDAQVGRARIAVPALSGKRPNISDTAHGRVRAIRVVAHDVCDGIVLPKHHAKRGLFFMLEEVQRIIRAAVEPYKTLYWLAAETGLRAGELTGLRMADLDFERGLIHVRQSAWRGKIQTPKTENAYRAFPLSPEMCEHRASFLRLWRPNEARLLFATRVGTPMDSNLIVTRKLRPLLRSLGIVGGGLHAFRHANETMMDRLNVPMKVRQERLGHSDPRLMLGTYTHTVDEDHRRFAAQLGAILHPTCTQTWD